MICKESFVTGRVAIDWATFSFWDRRTAKQMKELQFPRTQPAPERGRWQQYNGFQAEGRFWGRALQDGIKHFAAWTSGPASEEIAMESVSIEGLGDILSGKCTRLDVQLTLEDWDRQGRLSSLGERLAGQELGEWNRKGATPSITYYGSPDGDTIYIGNRKSAAMMRIYQKREAGGQPFVRVEMEYKAARAANLYLSYRHRGEYALQDALVAEVRAWPAGLAAELHPFADWAEGKLAVRPGLRRGKTDDDKRLEWLMRIAPSLQALTEGPRGTEARAVLAGVLWPKEAAT